MVITVDGWCYIFGTYANSPDEELEEDNLASGIEQVMFFLICVNELIAYL